MTDNRINKCTRIPIFSIRFNLANSEMNERQIFKHIPTSTARYDSKGCFKSTQEAGRRFLSCSQFGHSSPLIIPLIRQNFIEFRSVIVLSLILINWRTNLWVFQLQWHILNLLLFKSFY